MKVKDLIEMLNKMDAERTLNFVVNVDESEAKDKDILCHNLDLWDYEPDKVTLFISKWY